LNAAADKVLGLYSTEIAITLAHRTIDGNETSTKILFALADGQIDCEDEGMMQSLLSLAEKLAAEAECKNEATDAKAAVGSKKQGRV
jgi:hypothetical protein